MAPPWWWWWSRRAPAPRPRQHRTRPPAAAASAPGQHRPPPVGHWSILFVIKHSSWVLTYLLRYIYWILPPRTERWRPAGPGPGWRGWRSPWLRPVSVSCDAPLQLRPPHHSWCRPRLWCWWWCGGSQGILSCDGRLREFSAQPQHCRMSHRKQKADM